MGTILKIIKESILQAIQQLVGNKLRSFLSLLGVSIGIFSIIGVLSAVDSLEDKIRGNLQKLGDDIIYVSKWPWADVSGNWWDYLKRPNASFEDYQAIKEHVKTQDLVCFYSAIGERTIKFQSSSVEGALLFGATYELEELFKLDFAQGRYFSYSEYNYGSDKLVLGHKVSEELFGSVDPIGKQVKLKGRSYEVIGVLAEAGDDLINPLDFDDVVFVSFPNAKKTVNFNARYIFNTTVAVKAKEGINVEHMKDDMTAVLRASRRLPPKEGDTFSLNSLSMVAKIFDQIFLTLNFMGILIGAFAMLVGGVSVANIMFVSVKERTSLIGVKKALGAKRAVILLEFLIEAIILCIIGGMMGLGLIAILLQVLSVVLEFDLYMDIGNIAVGLFVSILIGVLAGFIPAWQASKLDPVEAMRH